VRIRIRGREIFALHYCRAVLLLCTKTIFIDGKRIKLIRSTAKCGSASLLIWRNSGAVALTNSPRGKLSWEHSRINFLNVKIFDFDGGISGKKSGGFRENSQ